MNKLWWAQGPNATYQATSSWALWFWRRRFLKGFYHIWAWWPSWSCDPDPANKFLFPHPYEAPNEIWLRLAQQFWRRRPLKMVDDRHRMDDGPWLYYKLTNEPKGSGELKHKHGPPIPHLLQAQQAPALPYAKVAGRTCTGSYPAPSPDKTTHTEVSAYH